MLKSTKETTDFTNSNKDLSSSENDIKSEAIMVVRKRKEKSDLNLSPSYKSLKNQDLSHINENNTKCLDVNSMSLDDLNGKLFLALKRNDETIKTDILKRLYDLSLEAVSSGNLFLFQKISLFGKQCWDLEFLRFCFITIDKGYIDILEELLTQEKNFINTKDLNGNTPLIYCQNSKAANCITRILLNSICVDVNAQNKEGETALMRAIKNKNLPVIFQLLEYYKRTLNFELQDKAGNTAFSLAKDNGWMIAEIFSSDFLFAYRFESFCIEMIRNQEYDLFLNFLFFNAKHEKTEKLLISLFNTHVSCSHYDWYDYEFGNKQLKFNFTEREKDVILLLLSKGYCIHEEGEYGRYNTPINMAVLSGDKELVKFLLNNAVQTTSSKNCARTLELAVKDKSGDLVSALFNMYVSVSNQEDFKVVDFYQCITKCISLKYNKSLKLFVRYIFESFESEELLFYVEYAANRGNYSAFKFLIKMYKKSEYRSIIGEHGRRWLLQSCSLGYLKMVKFLLLENDIISVHSEDSTDNPLLRSNSFAITKFLFECGADVNQIYSNKTTVGTKALQNAVKDKNVPLFLLLVKHCAKIKPNLIRFIMKQKECPAKIRNLCLRKFKGKKGMLKKTLLTAIRRNDFEFVKVLGKNGNIPRTALAIAVDCEDRRIAEYLIEMGANVNDLDLYGPKKLSVLIKAVIRRDINLVKFLVSKGADVNIMSRHGTSPLAEAILAKDKDITQFLLDNGANVNLSSPLESSLILTAISAAAKMNNFDLVKDLYERGASINNDETEESLTLKYAVKNTNLEMVQFLVKKGARVEPSYINSFDVDTVLIDAIERKSEEIVAFLLDNGASINKECLMQIAAKSGNGNIIRNLVKNGAHLQGHELREAYDSMNYETFSALLEMNAYDDQLLNETLSKDFDIRRKYSKFITALIQSKNYLSNTDSFFVIHRSVATKEMDILSALIQSGSFGPKLLTKQCNYEFKLPLAIHSSQNDTLMDFFFNSTECSSIRHMVSPLYVSLMFGCYSIAQDFVNMNFLSHSDLYKLPKDMTLRNLIKEQPSAIEILDKLESSVPSLFQISFVLVSEILSSNHGRKEKIEALKLPKPLKQALLFQGKIFTSNECDSRADFKARFSYLYPDVDPFEQNFHEMQSDSDYLSSDSDY